MSHNIPYTKKLDPYVDRKGSFELHAQLETLFVIPRVYGIRERQLFGVAWREKPNCLDHTGEGMRTMSCLRVASDVMAPKLALRFDIAGGVDRSEVKLNFLTGTPSSHPPAQRDIEGTASSLSVASSCGYRLAFLSSAQ